jgi:hypothetical protein
MATGFTIDPFADRLDIALTDVNGHRLYKSYTNALDHADLILTVPAGPFSYTITDRACLQGHTYYYWLYTAAGVLVQGPTEGRLRQVKVLGRGGGARGQHRRQKSHDYDVECELCGFKYRRNTLRRGYVKPHQTGENWLPNAQAPENWLFGTTLPGHWFDVNNLIWFGGVLPQEYNLLHFPALDKDSDYRTPPGQNYSPGVPLINMIEQEPIEYLENGDFEDLGGFPPLVFDHWDEAVAGAATISDEVVIVHSTLHSCKINIPGAGSAGEVSQTIPVTPGSTIEYGLWVYTTQDVDGVNGAAPFTFTDLTGGSGVLVDGDASVVPLSTWTEIVNTFVVPAGCTSISVALKGIYGGVGAGAVYWDNISVLEFIDNIVKNHSFETAGAGGADVFANWTEVLGTGAVVQDQIIPPQDGLWYCRLSWQAVNEPYVYQTIEVNELTYYSLGIWTAFSTYGLINTPLKSPQFSLYDEDNAAFIFPRQAITSPRNSLDWVQEKFAFQAPAGCGQVTIALYTDGIAYGVQGLLMHWMFDNISLTPLGVVEIGTPTSNDDGTIVAWVYKFDNLSIESIELRQAGNTLLTINADDLKVGWNRVSAEISWVNTESVVLTSLAPPGEIPYIGFGGCILTTKTGQEALMAVPPHRSSGIGVYTTGGMMKLCKDCWSGLRKRVPWE